LIVNIGTGLDTTFQRVDEGTVLWINIDLPDVFALRQKLIPDSGREMTIAKSVFDFTWIDDISQWTESRSISVYGCRSIMLLRSPRCRNAFPFICHLAQIAQVKRHAL
jgi:hypothetical protein